VPWDGWMYGWIQALSFGVLRTASVRFCILLLLEKKKKRRILKKRC
jgi:hypothetical protein